MTVVVGYSPDRYGDAAMRAAVAEAGLRGGDLVVVNATRGDALVDTRFADEAAVDELRAEMTRREVSHEIVRPVGGDVVAEVLTVVRERGADLLVIGLKHRSPVGKLLMGSTAQRLLLECPCPVLAVKPPA